MKKEDVLKKLAELEKVKNDSTALTAMLAAIQKDLASGKGRGNGIAIDDKTIVDALFAIMKKEACILVLTDKGNIVKFPFADNYRIYYKGARGERKAKKTTETVTVAKPEEKKEEKKQEQPKGKK